MRALLDTCVIIDGLQSHQPFCTDAQAIFLCAANDRFIGCITAKSATDIYYLMRRHMHDENSARAVLGKIFTLFDVIDTAGADCHQAISSAVTDYEDAVMVETAMRAGVDCIITRDMGDYRKAALPICTPKEFLQKINAEG